MPHCLKRSRASIVAGADGRADFVPRRRCRRPRVPAPRGRHRPIKAWSSTWGPHRSRRLAGQPRFIKQPRPRDPAARCARALPVTFRPPIERACGTPGARCTPRPRVQSKKAHELETTVTPATSGVPHAMVLAAYVVLSPAPDSVFGRRRVRLRMAPTSVEAGSPSGLDATRDIRTTRLCRPRAAWSPAFRCRLTDPRIGGDPPCLHVRA
jgi:hypothetical protein